MTLDTRSLRLIAVGASVAAHCQPCLQVNVAKARENGADEHEIKAAIGVGRRVREGAAAKMDAFAATLMDGSAAPAPAGGSGCGCRAPGGPDHA